MIFHGRRFTCLLWRNLLSWYSSVEYLCNQEAGSQILRLILRDSNHHADSEMVGMVIVMTMIFSSRCSSLYFKRSAPLRENGVVIYAFHL